MLWNSYEGVAPVNVFHVATASEDVTEIGEALVAAAEAAGPMFAPMPEQYYSPTFAVLPLDGETPTALFPTDWVDACQGDSDMIPASAYVYSFRTAQRGPRGRGRMYIGPISESTQLNGVVTGAAPGSMQTAWGEFVTAIGVETIGLVVASYVHEDFHPVLGLTLKTVCGTQRRRQDQKL